MTPEHKDIAQIEAYLSGALTKEEHQAFEKRLAEDADLQEEVAAYHSLLQGFEVLQGEAFGIQMQEWE